MGRFYRWWCPKGCGKSVFSDFDYHREKGKRNYYWCRRCGTEFGMLKDLRKALEEWV